MGAVLPLPEKGFARSVNVNNVNRPALGDWLEASALFLDEPFSTNDIADILVEQGVVDRNSDAEDEQDFAYNIAEEGWTEVRNRLAASGPSPSYRLSGKLIEPTANWQDDPIRSFLIILSLAPLYPKWAAACRDFGGQGSLFERVCSKACADMFKGWTVYEAGWGPAGAKTVKDIVGDLVDQLGVKGNAYLGEWAPLKAKDGGLDIMCFMRFPDQRECVPLFAIQCASGANWIEKLDQPSTNKWKTYLDSAFEPTRALTIPFSLDHEQMKQRSLEIGGPLFDRNRILSVGRQTDGWMADIRQELIDWCKPRVDLLPYA